MSNDLELDRVGKRFGSVVALRGVSVTVREGEFFSFLGPSGCGKTTILRLISGFIEPSEGEIRIGGASLQGISPHRRPTALIFQNLALFPLMSVADNIAFGLTVRGIPAADRRRKVRELLDFIALPEYAERGIDALSGGQKQRVAIARALAVEPAVLLLDEPLSALDLKLRQHMRSELRTIQRRSGITFVYITHDQGEALAMSDRIAVMKDGAIEQIGPPEEIYNRPATPFVASFVGENNVFRGRVEAVQAGQAIIATAFGPLRGANPRGLEAGAEAMLFVRPERLRLAEPGIRTANMIQTEITGQIFEGAAVNIFLRHAEGRDIAVTHSNDGSATSLENGRKQSIAFTAEDAIVLPLDSLAHD